MGGDSAPPGAPVLLSCHAVPPRAGGDARGGDPTHQQRPAIISSRGVAPHRPSSSSGGESPRLPPCCTLRPKAMLARLAGCWGQPLTAPPGVQGRVQPPPGQGHSLCGPSSSSPHAPLPHPTPPHHGVSLSLVLIALTQLYLAWGCPPPPRASPPLSTATLPTGPRLHPPPLRVWRKMANKHRPGTNSASPRGTRGAPVAGAEGGGAQRGGSAPPAGERESAELAQTLNPCLFRLWLFLKGRDWGQDRDGDPAGRGDPPGGGCGEWGVLGQGLGEAGGQRWWVAGVPVGC